MRKPPAKIITLTREQIGRWMNIEIQLHTDEMQWHLIVSRTPETGMPALCERHYRYDTVGALCDHLYKLFDESPPSGAKQTIYSIQKIVG